jgi:type IV pilus assembly protein PilM
MAVGLFQKGRYALDIGGSSVVVVGLSGKSGNLKLQTCFDWPLPAGLVVDGEIADADLFARELKAMANRHKLRGRAVELSVSNQKVIVRTIDMPEMTEEELVGAVQFQAQEYIPIPVEEVILDSMVTGKRVLPDGSTRQEVLLVAAQRGMIATLMAATKQAGLKVAGIDVSSLALVRALLPETPFFSQAGEAGICRGIADISSAVSTLVVAVDGVMKFTRIVNFSSDRFARSLTEANGIPFDDAQMMVQRIGLAGPLPSDNEYYPEEVVADTQRILGEAAGELAEEIRRSFDYYQGQEHATPVTELVLSGRGALLRNLDSHLSETLSLPVIIGNPLTCVAQNVSGVSDADLAAMAPCLAVAVGLAMPEED